MGIPYNLILVSCLLLSLLIGMQVEESKLLVKNYMGICHHFFVWKKKMLSNLLDLNHA